uniref:DNA-binding protein n=1 Tax=Schlesneria paludicola TaxID=360056 RepID=A0A7C2P5A6_9PLAN
MVVAVRPESTQVGDSDSLCTEPLLVSATVASSMCGKSLRTWRAWDSAGLIPRPIRIGRSTLWRTEELKEWVAAGCPRRAEWESHS